MKIKPVHIVGLILAFTGIFLAYNALSSSINPYLTVSQASMDSTRLGQEVQILATVSGWSTGQDGSLVLNLTDGASAMYATYRGVPPQGLREGQKIVAIGILETPARLNATRLLVKCPSKYE